MALDQRMFQVGGRSASNGSAPLEDSLSVLFPTLSEFLSEQRWADGSQRLTGTVLIMVDDGVWKMCLHDRHSALSAWLSAPSWSMLLDVAERKVVAAEVDWRKDKPAKGKK